MAENLDDAFSEVQALCKDFELYKDQTYLGPGYSESQARTDFIDKFITALGWDVRHVHQRNPYEQEVKVERNVNVGAGQKRADYAFFVAPNFRDVVFFVEAKKPTLALATADNYFQAIRYGWNSSTPLAVLTDFHSLHILDCRYKPDIDTAIHRAVFKFDFTDYSDPEKFAQLYWLISREAVATGSLEKRAAELPTPSRREIQKTLFKLSDKSIDEAFLEDLDSMRESLAKALKADNPALDGPALTEVTQRILDRLVFMRFLEDKLIETQESVGKINDGDDAWRRFVASSKRLDQRYNGTVFKHHYLIDSGKGLVVNDKVFADICDTLSDPNSPYDFNAIPIHILGSIYERFLGKIIVVTPKRARLEEKPEVRRIGGVYYTPEYIVRLIVSETVGKMIEGKKPEVILEMRFADIACGSGSFLLGIFDEIIRYMTKRYNQAKSDRAKLLKSGVCFEAEDGTLHLSLSARREVLLRCIYGVDIDNQAVEVAHLSLYLKLLEEATTATARNYQLEIGVALLPSLTKNIVAGILS